MYAAKATDVLDLDAATLTSWLYCMVAFVPRVVTVRILLVVKKPQVR